MCISHDTRIGPTTVRSFHKWCGVACMVLLLCASCAVVRPPEKRIPYPEGPVVPGVPTDEDLFLLGASYLGSKEITPDYFNARLAFEKLRTTYPDSRWRPAAQKLIQLIDEVQACNRISSQKEMLRILQENEKLKKDLERLRRLEIESEKRAKILK